jgi:hypothetical protein
MPPQTLGSHFLFENMRWYSINYINAGIKDAFFVHERFTVGLCNWFLVLVFTPWTAVLVRNLSKFLITNINKENKNSQGRGYVPNFFNSPWQEHLEFTPIIILITFFWSNNTLFALVELPQKIIPHLIVEWEYVK